MAATTGLNGAGSSALSSSVAAFTYTKRGKPADVLTLTKDFPLAAPAEDQVRVRVNAVALNPVDWKQMWLQPAFIGKRPAIAASDYSGTIVSSGVDAFKPGDQVFGIVHSSVKVATGLGALAQEINAPALACAHLPQGKDLTQSAGLPLVGLTAIALSKFVKPSTNADQSTHVLVCGASSSVGQQLVPILKHKGYRVAATCSQSKSDFVKGRGADETFDYRTGNLTQKLKAYVAEHGQFDTILDCADAFDVWQSSGSTLKKGSLYVNVGMNLTEGIFPVVKRLSSYFLWPAWLGGVPRTYKRPTQIATEENVKELSALYNDNVVSPVIDSQFKFEESLKAFERLMSNRATGKVLVNVSE